jgi:hypothetical protein
VRRAILCSGLVAAVGCGEATHEIAVALTHATQAGLDPFAPEVGVVKVRVEVDGPEAHDDAVLDLPAGTESAVFSGFPTADPVNVRALGLDAVGNVVAFGRVDRVAVTEDVSLQFPLRRNLAYITHQPNPAQDRPEGVVYLVDIATRGLVSKVRLPGAAPVARGVSARGGDAILVTFEDGGEGKVGLISAEDGSVQTLALPRPQELTLGVSGRALGVAVGGGVVTFVDLEARTVVEQFARPVGGRVLDGVISAGGQRALVVVSAAPGLIQIDLSARTVESLNVVPDPGGVALSRDGRVAYVTSSTERTVAAVDLENGRTRVLNGFVKPVGRAAYADELDAVLALDVSTENTPGRVLGFITSADEALTVDEGVRTLSVPTGIASDGVGRRALVVAAGTSTETAGLTMVETTAAALPAGASALYPTDPDDRFQVGPVELGQRYQPADVAIVYGR